MQLRFDYKEVSSSGSEIKSVLWNLGEVDAGDVISSTNTIFADGEAFYEYLGQKIPVDSDVTERNVRGFEIILTAASSDLYTYILTKEPSSSLAQNKPTYSNVEGALGIFSSRATITQYKPYFTPPPSMRALNQNSTKELCNGSYTVALDFCSDIAGDPSPYACN